jgi:hypothetical protein
LSKALGFEVANGSIREVGGIAVDYKVIPGWGACTCLMLLMGSFGAHLNLALFCRIGCDCFILRVGGRVDMAISWGVCHGRTRHLGWNGLSLYGILRSRKVGVLHRLLTRPTEDGRGIVCHQSRLRMKNVEGGSIKESSQPVLSRSRGSWKCEW